VVAPCSLIRVPSFKLQQRPQTILILRFRYVPIVDASGLKKLKIIIRDLQKKDLLNSRENEMIEEESCLFLDIDTVIAYAKKNKRP
jgi:hypothetical protein